MGPSGLDYLARIPIASTTQPFFCELDWRLSLDLFIEYLQIRPKIWSRPRDLSLSFAYPAEVQRSMGPSSKLAANIIYEDHRDYFNWQGVEGLQNDVARRRLRTTVIHAASVRRQHCEVSRPELGTS